METSDFDFPRLLFITPCAFNHVTGGGVTFTNLFRGWPKEKIATVHCDTVPVSRDICENYYYLSRELAKIFPFRRLFARIPEPKMKISEEKSPPVKNAPAEKNQKDRLIRIVKYFAKRVIGKERFQRILGNSDIPEKFVASPELIEFLDAYRPQIIYTILGSNAIMELIEWACCKYNCSLAVHIMDDWYADKYSSGIFRHSQRKQMEKLMAKLFARATLLMSICEAMSKAYKERFGYEFVAFHNAIETEKWKPYINKHPGKTSSPAVVRYIGSVLPYAQARSLVDIAQAVDAISQREKISFELYVPNIYRKNTCDLLAFSNNCRVCPEIRDDVTFYRTMASADLLVLAANFDTASLSFIRYSMPAKVPAYLLSKTPILVYGSLQTTQVQYAQQYAWGYCVVERNMEKLQKAITRMLKDRELRIALSEKAFEFTCENFDAKKMASQFQRLVRKIWRKPCN